ncbi:DegT/DnrJ/EryC1/StrS aminotransferase family protein [Ancylomarina sp. 16SWW S1-10-2]|uniref:DegT/DnrJ/EryC1/StrS family aminotransferase n=1 Tax=Ancylomarina sp. 16SWW S1-10-2 TaxID=2499681 RepID=UPI0012ADB203|nr:aminotransferase class I/II-fold pyridoxal phosphate-dependent enzyme [Ancylomarina sp. 16SWW S1-10-2]MRT93416.1 aminotransferase class I/II-fold pyridoxal phosphate-dependent enzyme [Ancylomarina sp. 16SWW S1-10-2]
MQDKIWLSSPHMGGNEMTYVQEAYDTNWVAPLGHNVNEFERSLADYIDVKQASALSAGTAALHLALIMLGVQAGDEVIVQSFTFSASVNPVLYLGATPIFVDSEEDTWNMSPIALKEAIDDRISKGKKPKAIIPVHLYGMPAKMKEIKEIANFYSIPIVEDAAEALGSTLDGIKMGAWGKLGVLSFNGNKIITTSGGGALVSDDETLIEKSRFLASQSRDDAPYYQHSEIGYNYRMSNIVAGIGRGQMEVLSDRVKQRRKVNAWYKILLAEQKGIHFHNAPTKDYYSNYWLTSIIVDPKETGGITHNDIRLALEKENIESRLLWKPMHLQPIFSKYPFYSTGVSESLFEKGLCLPSGSNMSENDMERIKRTLKQILKF